MADAAQIGDQSTGSRIYMTASSTGASSAERMAPDPRMTLAEFVERKFLPEHIATKRTPGRRHYHAILKHILHPERVDRMFNVNPENSKIRLKSNPSWPYMDGTALQDIRPENVQELMSKALESGYSAQTAKHIRNVLSAILAHAIKQGYFSGANPAILVAPPGMQRKTSHVLTFAQTVEVLQAMRYPEWEISVIALLSGMTIAEICGLLWKNVNLSDRSVQRENEIIPAMSIAVRLQLFRGELSSVPQGRRKIIPIPIVFRPVFVQLSRARNTGWNDYVLVSKSGKPVNQINLAARRLKVIGERLNLPWLSWQVFRRTRAALVTEFGAQLPYQLAMAITMKLGFTPIGSESGSPR